MRATILPEHRQLFFEKGYIEFQDIFSIDKIRSIEFAVNLTICKKLDYPEKFVHHISPADQYQNGFELWRENDTVRSIVFNKLIANIMLDLLKERDLFIAYDTILNCSATIANEAISIIDSSSVSKMVGAAILCLKPDKEETAPYLPKSQSDITFIRNDYVLEENFTGQGVYLMIGFAQKPMLYIYNSKNIHNNALQKLGYDFGDLLKRDTHPIVKL